MDRQISEIGTIPATTSIIESLYPELKSANKKVTWLEKQGFIIRLKRGLYVANPKHSGKTLSSELIANHLYTPSYISMSTALRYYGLIPEAVYVHQSMTVKHPRSFQTPVGNYDYKYISRKAFPIGVRSMNKGDYAFLIASPEKALCDLIVPASSDFGFLKIRLMDFKPDKNPFKEFPANAQPKTPPNTIYTDGISTKLSTITLKS